MDLKYVSDAVRTEAKVDAVFCNRESLIEQLKKVVEVANALDKVKKGVFYAKGDDIGQNFIDVNPRIFHGIIGMVTEVGELVEILLKQIEGKGILDVQSIFEELGDVFWYTAILMHDQKVSPERVCYYNIAKLRTRFPEKFTEDSYLREHRDLLEEQKALMGIVAPDNLWKSTPFQGTIFEGSRFTQTK